MDNHKLIWTYIDGRCTSAEEDLFKSHMKSQEFAMAYQEALSLHHALIQDTPQSAPADLIDLTLARVGEMPHKSSVSITPWSFKPLIVYFVLVIAGMLLAVLVSNPASSIPAIDIWTDWLPAFSGGKVMFGQVEWSPQLLCLAILVLSIPAVYRVDKILNSGIIAAS